VCKNAQVLHWDDLRVFLRAAESRTLAGAARSLKVEHTTVGRRLAALEHALGASLMLRRPDGIVLTPLGEQVVPLAKDVERAVAALLEVVATGRRQVRLAVPTGVARLFGERIGELRARHPALSLEILSSAQPVRLERGEADLALRMGSVTGGGLIVRKLGELGSALYGAPRYLSRRPVRDPDDLTGHDLIGFDQSLAKMPAAQWLAARSRNATVVMRSRELADLANAAIAGAGLAVLPALLADNDPGLRRVGPFVGLVPMSLVYPPEARERAEVRAVIAFVRAVVRDRVKAIAQG
jgi:DNA-binding transcriptional LysR family regulator